MEKSMHRIRVHAPEGRVYQALTSKEGLQGWFTPHVDGDVRDGAEVGMSFNGREPFRWRLSHFQPQRSVQWDGLDGPGAAAGTTVVFKLGHEGAAGTVVECDHENWPEGHEALRTCNTLWGILMGRLKEYVEHGTARPAFD